MGLSANSIVHFTHDKDSLKGILANHFKIKYCKETLFFGKNEVVIYVPMVSFCDIPMSQVKDHIEKYGSYGLGLTREWAIRNRLNPVFYIEPDSHLAESYDGGLGFFYNLNSTLSEDAKPKEYGGSYNKILDFVRYIKLYEGPLIRKGYSNPKYRYADEKEWRYVPPIGSGCVMHYHENSVEKPGVKDDAARSVQDLRLRFSPEDIRYIIIQNDSEIHEFIRHMQDEIGPHYSMRDVERLTTRIITSEQIKTDF